jgi:hypothetical protein
MSGMNSKSFSHTGQGEKNDFYPVISVFSVAGFFDSDKNQVDGSRRRSACSSKRRLSTLR